MEKYVYLNNGISLLTLQIKPEWSFIRYLITLFRLDGLIRLKFVTIRLQFKRRWKICNLIIEVCNYVVVVFFSSRSIIAWKNEKIFNRYKEKRDCRYLIKIYRFEYNNIAKLVACSCSCCWNLWQNFYLNEVKEWQVPFF